jgi:hypothetical protein
MTTANSLSSGEKKKKIAHIIAGMVILVHSFEKYESGHSSWLFFAIAGIVFISIALLHHIIEQKAPWIDGVFFSIEGILSLAIAYDYFHMGKKGLPLTYLTAGIIQLAVAFMLSKKGINRHKQAA